MKCSFIHKDYPDLSFKTRQEVLDFLNKEIPRTEEKVEPKPEEKKNLTKRQKVGKVLDKTVPYYPELKSVAKGIKTALHTTLSPSTVKTEGQKGGAILRENLGEQQAKQDKATETLKSAKKLFDKMSNPQLMDFIDNMEHGRLQRHPELQKISDALRTELDKARENVRGLGKGLLETFNENYFPHFWERPGVIEKGKDLINRLSKRPFQGQAGFTKQRTVEFFKQGVEERKLTPVTWNPVDLTLMKIREMERFVMAHKTMAAEKEAGFVKFFRMGVTPPEGYSKIDDKISKVFYKDKDGHLVQSGNYYAQEDVARILNNFLSKGLRGNALYEGWRGIGNAMTQAQLGLSAFHAGFTSFDAAISKVANGLEYIYHGYNKEGIKALANSPAAPVTNYYSGKGIEAAWKGKNKYSILWGLGKGTVTPEMRQIAKFVEMAGGRVKMDDFYAQKYTEQIRNTWRNHNAPTAIFETARKAPWFLLEQFARPIMEELVPRQKLGVFADMVRYDLKIHPNLSHEERRLQVQKTWNSVDNRMGQMVYDNNFWHKTTKDIAFASVRSVGWNLGTFREIGGAPGQLFQVGKKALLGKGEYEKAVLAGRKDEIHRVSDLLANPKPGKFLSSNGKILNKSDFTHAEDTHKLAYLISLIGVSALSGAMYQYARTGKGPETLEDYFFPRTGEVDENGIEERVSLPTYVKDLFHYGHNFPQGGLKTLQNKLSPAFSVFNQLMRNKDYFNVKIVPGKDKGWAAALDRLEFLGKQMIPFGVQNIMHQEGEGFISKAQNLIGITKAPTDLSRTPAEERLIEMIQDRQPQGGIDPEKYAEYRQLAKIEQQYKRTKDVNVLRKAVNDGIIKESDLQKIKANVHVDHMKRAIKNMGIDDVLELWKLANDKEKDAMRETFKSKIDNAFGRDELTDEERQHIKDVKREAGFYTKTVK